MDFDFALLLVGLTFATGIIWLLDRLFFFKCAQGTCGRALAG